MIKFLHHLFNPHCQECVEARACQSCATLREQLNRVNNEKQQLMELILEKQKPDTPRVPLDLPKGPIPWKIRQQMLEQEDKIKAEVLKRFNNPVSNSPSSVEKLEKELDIAREENRTK